MKPILLLLSCLFLAPLTAFAADDVTTIILVRHAEKASLDDDPHLSEAGLARANELARVLEAAGVDAIYVTQYQRTKQTAAPAAAKLKLEPKAIATGATYAASVVKDITTHHAGETVLVVGHSNSTVNVMRELGAKDVQTIEESSFDDLFVCTIVKTSPVSCVTLRYGQVAR